MTREQTRRLERQALQKVSQIARPVLLKALEQDAKDCRETENPQRPIKPSGSRTDRQASHVRNNPLNGNWSTSKDKIVGES
jgi:hypothetical protein